MAKKRKVEPVTITVWPRRLTTIVNITVLALLLAIIVRMIVSLGAHIELLGSAVIVGWLMLESIRLLFATITVVIDDETIEITRGQTVLFNGRYYAAKRTVIPLKGLAFAVEPMGLVPVLTMNFTHVFVLNVRRDRIAFPGIFVAGLDNLWDAVPETLRAS